MLLEDLEDYFSGNQFIDFLGNIKRNTMRYITLFSEAADQIDISRETTATEVENFNNALDAFRVNNVDPNREAQLSESDNKLFKLLKRKFELVIVPGPNSKHSFTPLRMIKSSKIGGMIETRAMVVRVSEVKPLINIACYFCEICGYELY